MSDFGFILLCMVGLLGFAALSHRVLRRRVRVPPRATAHVDRSRRRR
ncbi:hypothetical protein [Tahibacter caeni]|nr:hypothetical protein [Tahibacter caeni]